MLYFIWRAAGLFLLPFLLLHPKARRHILRVPFPKPGCIWLHGASAGEHKALQALIPHLPRPHWRTHSSWRTSVNAAPAPLDLPFVFRRWLDWARPSMLILVEAELWPGWLEECRRKSIPIVVVNARPSKSQERWKRMGLWKSLSKEVLFLSQLRFGDLKSEAPLPPFRIQFASSPFIAACTHPEDGRDGR